MILCQNETNLARIFQMLIFKETTLITLQLIILILKILHEISIIAKEETETKDLLFHIQHLGNKR